MSTLLHLLMWVVVTGAVVLAGTVVTGRWVWRRTRRAVSARLDRVSGRSRNPLSLSSSIDGRALRVGVTCVASAVVRPARLRVQAAVPGRGRQIAVVRRDLKLNVTGAARAVAAGRQDGRPVEALDSIVRRLGEQARALDVDLAVIAAEPDGRVREQLLAGQAERVALLRRACADVRRGVLLAGSTPTATLLSSVVDELNDEVIAMGLRARAYAELTRL